MKRKIVVSILFIAIVALGIYRIFESVQKRKITKQVSKQASEFVYTVKVKPAEFRPIADSINFVGEIKGINEVSVLPKVMGRLVRKIKEEGSYVKKDEVICEIDRDEPVLKYTLYELKSPIDGILAKYFVDVGGMVSQQTPVCIISDTSKVRIVFSVAENFVNKIQKNSYVRFEVEGKTFVSKNLQLSNYIDPVSRSMEVRVVLDNPNGDLKSGSFVKGELVFYEKYSLVVPSEAVLDVDNKKVVYVVKEDKTVEEREVKTGLRYKDYTEILSGVKQGEKVVYQGVEVLTNGMRVEIIEL
jgi:multidrug efflux pump subunit AcrA (membrane-fusion protein)